MIFRKNKQFSCAARIQISIILLSIFLQGILPVNLYAQTQIQPMSGVSFNDFKTASPILQGVKIDPRNPFHFTFIVESQWPNTPALKK